MTDAWRLTPDASLQSLNTFGVAARTPCLLELYDSAALPAALALPEMTRAPWMVLGSGSNVLLADATPGAVLVFRTEAISRGVDRDGHAIVLAEAGVCWHRLVMWSLQQGLCGLENLALIPGTVGASPIQNIGAYGSEVGEFIARVQVWDLQAARLDWLDRAACRFAYRDSVFKQQPGRWLVTAVEFALPLQRAPRVDYAGVAEELHTMAIQTPSCTEVAEAVIRIRRRKLPDPAVLGNAGSFFKNPIVPAGQAAALLAEYPALPVFRGDGDATRKLSAAWMIEACGFKGAREGDAGVAPTHALVLVNHGHASGAQLLALARRIAEAVRARFGVAIEPEPRLVGAQW
jgi:UDP-N-acetylmuramate dehydrogenase